MNSSTVTAVIVGAGNRGMEYSKYALTHPDELIIVGVADPSSLRRKLAAEKFNLQDQNCFRSAIELAQRPKMADAIINCTMDKDHVPTSTTLMSVGYDILLEKPFATSEN